MSEFFSIRRGDVGAEVKGDWRTGYVVFGWTEWVFISDGQPPVPVSRFVSDHMFKFMARRSMRRWLSSAGK